MTDDHPNRLRVGGDQVGLRYALSLALGLEVDWSSYARKGCASFQYEDAALLQQSWIRYVLLRASEVRYRRKLLGAMHSEQVDVGTSVGVKPKTRSNGILH